MVADQDDGGGGGEGGEIQKQQQQPEIYLILWALAEEYAAAGHALAGQLSCGGVSKEYYQEYCQLIASAIRCLSAALQEPYVPDEIQLRMLIQKADILSTETENWKEAEALLYKAIDVAQSRESFVEYKFTSLSILARLLRNKSPKSALKAIEDGQRDAQLLNMTNWSCMFRLLKIQLGFSKYASVSSLSELSQSANSEFERYSKILLYQSNLLQASSSEAQPQLEFSNSDQSIFKMLYLMQRSLDLAMQAQATDAISVLKELHAILDDSPLPTSTSTAFSTLAVDVGGSYIEVAEPLLQETFAYACLVSGVVHLPDSSTMKSERFLQEGLRLVEELKGIAIMALSLSEHFDRRIKLHRLESYLLFYLSIAYHTRSNHQGAQELRGKLQHLDKCPPPDPFITSALHFLCGLEAHYAANFEDAILSYDKVSIHCGGDLYAHARLCKSLALRFNGNPISELTAHPSHCDIPTSSELQLQLGVDLEKGIPSTLLKSHENSNNNNHLLTSRNLLGNIIYTSNKHMNNTFRIIALSVLGIQFAETNPEQAEKMLLAANTLSGKEKNIAWAGVTSQGLANVYTLQGKLSQAAALKSQIKPLKQGQQT